MRRLTRYFFQGLLVLLPVVATVYVTYLVFDKLNGLLFRRLGEQVGQLLNLTSVASVVFTGLGLATTVVVIILAGVFGSNVIGGAIVRGLEKLVAHVPLVKLLYSSLKDLLGAFVGDRKGFEHPVLVALDPGGAVKVLGFITRESLEFLGIHGHVAVYLPQSYNFAGNLLVVPGDRVQRVRAHSSEVMTFLVSGGVSGARDAPGGERVLPAAGRAP